MKTNVEKPKKLLRLTRHSMLPPQRQYLEERYGPLEVIEHKDNITKHSLNRLSRIKPDLVEMVGPLTLIEEARRVFKVPVLKAVMHRTVQNGGRLITTFSHYVRYKHVAIETERI